MAIRAGECGKIQGDRDDGENAYNKWDKQVEDAFREELSPASMG
jgi:hypothetical protein